jgi:hypothetical protein
MTATTPSTPPGIRAEPEALIEEARRHQRRRHRRLISLAAVVVTAGLAGLMLSQIGPGGRTPAQPLAGIRLAAGPARYTSAPVYYAYIVQGNIYNYVSHGTQYSMWDNRYIKIRATATGRLLATISPPKPYNAFAALITADAGGRTFVFAAQRFWMPNAGPSFSPRLFQRDRRTPMKFLLVHITPAGYLQQAMFSLPQAVTPAQVPTIALSPNGTRLAVAFGARGQTAVVQVITLATGQARQWVAPHSLWRPVLNGNGAWTADGRTLAFAQWAIPPPPSLRYATATTTWMRLLDTTAPGTSLSSSRHLVLRLPAGESTPAYMPFLTPDGTKLISPVANEPLGPGNRLLTGELAVYSAHTGALLTTLAPWVWSNLSPPAPGRGGSPEQTVAWSNRTGSQLIILQPRDDLNILGVLTANTFVQAGGELIPQRPAAYQDLQYALRIAPQTGQ